MNKFKILSFLSNRLNAGEPPGGRYSYADDLYLGDSVRKRWKRICRQLEAGIDPGVCFLILSTSAADQLDLIESKYLLNPYYRQQHIRIVGIAADIGDAKLVLLRMMQQCYNRTQTADLRRFLEPRFREEVTSS